MKNAYVREMVLINLFLAGVCLSFIPDYNPFLFVIKGGISLLLFLAIFFDIKEDGIDIKDLFKAKDLRIFWMFLLFMLIYPPVTLAWSLNIYHGFNKYLNLIFSIFPLLFAYYYLLKTKSPLRKKVLTISVIFWSILSSVAIIALFYLNFYNFYMIKGYIWIQYVAAILLSVCFLYAIFLIIGKAKFPLIITSAIIGVALIYSLYLINFKEVIVSLIIAIGFLAIMLIIKREKVFNTSIFLIMCGVGVLAIFMFPASHLAINDSNATASKNLTEPIDISSVKTKLDAYKISFDRLYDNPFTGIGFGGFKSLYRGNNAPLSYKSPQDIFLEYWLELGLPGLIFFILLTIIIIRNVSTAGYRTMAFFIFAFILALISNDITTNILIYMGMFHKSERG